MSKDATVIRAGFLDFGTEHRAACDRIIAKLEHDSFYGAPPSPPPQWVVAQCCDEQGYVFVLDDRSVAIDCGDSAIYNAKFCPHCGTAFVVVPNVTSAAPEP